MRFDQKQAMTAADYLNKAPLMTIKNDLMQYGDFSEKKSLWMAESIVTQRKKRFFSKEIKTTANKTPILFYDKIKFPPERLEMTVEDLILYRIFGDWDHNFMWERHNSVGGHRITNSVFDLEKAIHFWDEKPDLETDRINKVTKILTEKQRNAILYYLDILYKNFAGKDNLKSIEKLCKKIQKETGELPEIMTGHTALEFQQKVLKRIEEYRNRL
jgi:hypothetical protein